MENLGSLQQILQVSQQMQARVSELQERLAKEKVTARSGGGMIEVTADGRGNIRSIKLDPEVVDPEDVEMLEDLILSAVSEVQRQARERMEGEMKKAAGGLPLPNLPGLFGG